MNDASPADPLPRTELCQIPLGNGQFIIYAPLRRSAFVANSSLSNALARWQVGESDNDDWRNQIEALAAELGLMADGHDDWPSDGPTGSPQPTTVTLFLTTACNLRCTYCYAKAGDTPVRSMPLEVAQRGIRYILANACAARTSAIEINYHGGGEPSSNWRVMTQSLAYAQKLAAESGLGVLASAATNGFLREDQLQWMIANLQGASVSFDGLPSVQDAHRKTAGGETSSGRVMHTLRSFDDSRFPYGIRVTVTADAIPQLPESIQFICDNFGAERIQVEPAYQMGRWRDAPSAETEAFVAAYREAQARAAACGRELFFSAARLGILTNHFCGVTQDSFALSPDGNVSACFEAFSEEVEWAPIFFYGTPDEKSADGYRFDVKRLQHLRRQAVQHRKWCAGCFARWTCAGDCYHKALGIHGLSEFAGTDRCHVIRELTKDQILRRIAESGGLCWRGTPSNPVHAPAGKEFLWGSDSSPFESGKHLPNT